MGGFNHTAEHHQSTGPVHTFVAPSEEGSLRVYSCERNYGNEIEINSFTDLVTGDQRMISEFLCRLFRLIILCQLQMLYSI
jgi:hypothetical protein